MTSTAILLLHRDNCTISALDPSGDFLATGDARGDIAVWSFAEQDTIYLDPFSTTSAITSISWLTSCLGMVLICGTRDGNIILSTPVGTEEWDATGSTAFRGHDSAVIGLLGGLMAVVSATVHELTLWSCIDGITCERRGVCDLSGMANGASVVKIAEKDESIMDIILFFDNRTIVCYSFLTETIIWCITNPGDCGLSLYISGAVIFCTKHRLQVATTGTDCPRIRQVAASATHFSRVQDTDNLFLIRTLEGDVIVWDAEKGDVLFYLDITDLGNHVHNDTLSAFYDKDELLLRIIAFPEGSTEGIVWNLTRCCRRNPPTPKFTTLRDVKIKAPTKPKRTSKRQQRLRAAKRLRKALPHVAVPASVILPPSDTPVI
ncbi:hypothetical protein BD410DRAFT_844811 [Rickenella mellea]|uniref:WD40 repeat-like protein n=1 Tax=Rickenella mellea TaxID=50990 RepID=A0A4Y7PLI5_9AGAM|nr:hypothetical protein BD410DRAFT_844811 [Rickenella mellea]